MLKNPSLQWTPEGRRVLTGSTSGEFTLWNGLTFNFETILQAHDSAIRAIRFSHSGSYVASADQSGIIKYFQPNMNNLTAWQGHREAIRGLSFSPDDSRFVTASDDSTIALWSFETQERERVLTGEKHGWAKPCFLLSTSQDTAGMSDVLSGTLIKVFLFPVARTTRSSFGILGPRQS